MQAWDELLSIQVVLKKEPLAWQKRRGVHGRKYRIYTVEILSLLRFIGRIKLHELSESTQRQPKETSSYILLLYD